MIVTDRTKYVYPICWYNFLRKIAKGLEASLQDKRYKMDTYCKEKKGWSEYGPHFLTVINQSSICNAQKIEA